MSTVLTVSLPATEFDIGRVIEAVDGVDVELETVVPLGEQTMALLSVEDADHESFAGRLEGHDAVAAVVAVNRSEEKGTYAVEWTEDLDSFYDALREQDGIVLKKDGSRWEFDLLFLTHESLMAFRERITDSTLDFDVRRVSRSDQPTSDPHEGLSDTQRETLDLAISEGYYAIPRETTTDELAAQLGISDQAVVERLRRAVATLGAEHLTASQMYKRP